RARARAVAFQLKEELEDLALGRVSPRRLLIARRLSKAPVRYTEGKRTAEAVRQLLRAGVRLHPGQTVRYLVVAAHGAKPSTPNDGSVRVQAEAFLEHASGYDVEYYQKLLRGAAEEILSFFRH